jgi:hypothetical protein
MSGITSKTKAAALARVQALIAGTPQHFPNGSFTLGNVAFTTASLVQELQSLAGAMQKLDATQASAKDARKALQETAAKVDPLVRDYKRFLLAAFSTATQTLADFGMQPPAARKPLPTEKRAAATAKMRATRKARGTTSRKQKLAVKGDVTGVVVTPITQPVSVSPTQPASSASSAPRAAPPK